MNFYATFSIPFIVGVVTMFVVLIVKYGSWIFGLSAADRMRIVKGIPSRQTPLAVWEVVRESLLHRRIFKVNPLLGYMHMSLAFGWFLLIVVGWIETVAYLGFRYVPLHGHVFFKYFATELPHKPVFDFLMDLLLLFVLSGVTLAFGKRIYSQAMGMRRTTRHVLGDRIALSVLWLIFPARLLAESITCALHGGGGFLTGTIGEWMAHHVNPIVLQTLYEPLWWAYSSGAVLRSAAFLALYAYLHRNSPDFSAPLQAAFDREGGIVRSFPDRCLLALRHLHRPLSVAERIGDRRRAVGLFPA